MGRSATLSLKDEVYAANYITCYDSTSCLVSPLQNAERHDFAHLMKVAVSSWRPHVCKHALVSISLE